eukprot:SAG31_NODE_6678_length_1928_cov_2.726627_3_plen_376_part_01
MMSIVVYSAMEIEKKNIDYIMELYDVLADRQVKIKNPHGRRAKSIYRQYIDLGYAPEMILPNDLKYYPDSRRFRVIKDPTGIDFSKIAVNKRTAFQNYMSSFKIMNSTDIPGYSGFELANAFRPTVKNLMQIHGGLKFQLDAHCKMVKYLDGEILTQDTRWVNSQMMIANNEDELEAKLTRAIEMIKEKIPELEAMNGSMWVFKQVYKLELHADRYKPLVGSSYVELPKKLKDKFAIVNVKNDDNECFKWAVLSALYPVERHACRVSKYKDIDHGLKFTQFPMPITDLEKFQNMNDISINLYGCDVSTKGVKQDDGTTLQISKCDPYIIQKSDQKKSRHIDLLLYKDHYSWIKNFSRFLGKVMSHRACKTHYCNHC